MACVWYCSIYAIGWKVVMHTTGINQIFVDTEVGVRVLLLKIRYCLGFLQPSVGLSQIAISSIIQTSSSVHSSIHDDSSFRKYCLCSTPDNSEVLRVKTNLPETFVILNLSTSHVHES